MKARKWIRTLAIVALSVVAVEFLLYPGVPPRSQTCGAMHISKRRILRYAAEHGSLPVSIQATDELEGYYNSTTDAWGNELTYEVAPNGDVTLTSLGRDNRPGGIGDDKDMIGVFPSRQADGRWSEELVDWTLDPFLG